MLLFPIIDPNYGSLQNEVLQCRMIGASVARRKTQSLVTCVDGSKGPDCAYVSFDKLFCVTAMSALSLEELLEVERF